MRWAYELSDFDFKIIHKPGTSQIISDALSRREQDLPANASDLRISSRERALLKPQGEGLILRTGWLTEGDRGLLEEEVTLAEAADPPTSPFEDPDLSSLWKTALKENPRYWKIRHAVRSGER